MFECADRWDFSPRNGGILYFQDGGPYSRLKRRHLRTVAADPIPHPLTALLLIVVE